MSRFDHGHRARSIAAAAVTSAALLLAPAGAATAAPNDTGYLRLAHLSIDTAAVDITLSALSGGTALYALSDVGYGGVSNYMALDEGTYSIAMVPAGAASDTTPVVSASVDVEAGMAQTVAVLGENADLETLVLDDDLETPEGDDSRVRVIQAATGFDTVGVTTADGTTLVEDGELGAVGDYVDLPSGTTELRLAGDEDEHTADVELQAGAVQTLFILTTADGALSVTTVADSVGVTETPIGGVDTGGGALAHGATSTPPAGRPAALAAVAALGIILTAGLLRSSNRGRSAGDRRAV